MTCRQRLEEQAQRVFVWVDTGDDLFVLVAGSIDP